MPRQTPDANAIRALASPEVFQRGRDYRRGGAVSSLVARGDVVTAAVEGSDVAPYRVTIRLEGSRVAEADCDCPYDWGGVCKHVVAVLLTLADDPGAAIEKPPLQTLLDPLDREALAALLLKRAEIDPGFAGWIEADLATRIGPGHARIDPAPVAAQARAVLSGRYRRRDYWDEYRPRGDVSELKALVDKAVPLLEAGDGRNALGVLEAVSDVFVDEWVEFASDSDEHMYELFHDLGQMMAEAALMSDLDDAEREVLAVTLDDWQERLSDYGLDDAFVLAAQALRSGWDDPKLQAILDGKGGSWPGHGSGASADALDEDAEDDAPALAAPVLASGDDAQWLEARLTAIRLRVLDAAGRSDAYLDLARASGAHAEAAAMLARLGRTREAAAHARKTFTRPDESLRLAQALTEAGAQEAAFGVAEDGLRLRAAASDQPYRPGASPVPLARWLRAEAAAAGRADLALTAARLAFERTLGREDFCAVRPLAGAEWEGVRRDLLAHLIASKHAGDRTEILLDEGLIDEAVQSVGEPGRHHTERSLLLRLMEAAHASHPDWVIRVAERNAEEIMARGSAGIYEHAAEWLKRAAMAYDAAGRIDAWSVRIEGLIETHRRKYKLRPLLEALRFDG